MLTQDYAMLYLKAKEKQYLDALEKQRYYEIFELPFLIKQILTKIKEVKVETRKVSDLRK
jgi:hypothetical protein